MWCIVIRDAVGEHYREVTESKPTLSELEYWESFYSLHMDAYSVYKKQATVVNIFQVEDYK